MKLHIFVEEDKSKAKDGGKRKNAKKPTQDKTPKTKQPDKQKAQKAYWAKRKAQEKKAAILGGENNENKE